MSLSDEIKDNRTKIHTDGYSMSVGELLSLYRDQELDVHPEFQRFFRWTATQKSRLIESILLGIPVPGIFVSQRENGVWEVVDGLQRLSTLFELTGVLRNSDGATRPPLVLEGTEYLPSLAGLTWDGKEDGTRRLDDEARLLIKRAKFDVKILKRESDVKAKYELFQRLNTGGTFLSDQELRNCIAIMIDRSFYKWMSELAVFNEFQGCIAMSDEALLQRQDQELVVRFLALRRRYDRDLRIDGDLGDFLNKEVARMAEDPTFNRDEERRVFEKTFTTLWQSMQDESFRRYDANRDRFVGKFLISAYEAIAIGLGSCIVLNEAYSQKNPREVAISIWQDPDFLNSIGAGANLRARIPATIGAGRKHFAKGDPDEVATC